MTENGLTQITISNKGITWELKKLIESNKDCQISDGKISASEWNKTMDTLAEIDIKRRQLNKTPIFACSCYSKSKDRYQNNFVVHPGQKIEFTQDEMAKIYESMGVTITKTSSEAEQTQKQTPKPASEKATTPVSVPTPTTEAVQKKDVIPKEEKADTLTNVAQKPEENQNQIVVSNDKQDKTNNKDTMKKLLTIGGTVLLVAGVCLLGTKAKKLTNKVPKVKNNGQKIGLSGKFRLFSEKLEVNRINKNVNKQETKFNKEYNKFMDGLKKVEKDLEKAEYDYIAPDYSIKHVDSGKKSYIIQDFGFQKTMTLVNNRKYNALGASFIDEYSNGILGSVTIDAKNTTYLHTKIRGTKTDDFLKIGKYKKYNDGKIEIIKETANNKQTKIVENGKIKDLFEDAWGNQNTSYIDKQGKRITKQTKFVP
ncbi:MAG: hypothetical protein MJ231_01245 [bacterium]|nr:hypothetical protein [bacterium]